MPEEYNKILKDNKGEKSMRLSCIIIADLERLLEKVNTCHNNPEKLSTTKINKHTHLVIHCLYIVHLIEQKISLIIIEVKIVRKTFV